MLFNSYIFLLLFMPVVLLSITLIRRFGLSDYLVPFLSLASFAFYAYWDVRYVPVLLGSILFNYAVGTALTTREGDKFNKALLIFGVAGNLALLGYFKYAGFFAENFNAALQSQITVIRLVLPLGVSFFTFTQIEYLVDAYEGLAPRYALNDYVLFVSFFPHLIAGPILRHGDMIPQFREGLKEWSDEAFAAGCLFFAMGLFKKAVIADQLAPWANTAFSGQSPLTLIEAWIGALTYTFQLYFDFSGYSDMAVGLALMLNVRIPFNFDSPYKSLSIVEFWRRWHITLSNFLRDYLYIPLGGSRRGSVRTTVNLLVTFVLGGLWHGAGWTFILWGAWHGLLLSINHAWLHTKIQIGRVITWLLTFVAVVVGWVVFRSPSIPAAAQYLASMAGANGIVLPTRYQSFLGRLALPGVTFRQLYGLPDSQLELRLGVLALLLGFVLVLPNTQQLVEKMKPQVRWAVFAGACFLVGFLMIGHVSTFLYYQF